MILKSLSSFSRIKQGKKNKKKQIKYVQERRRRIKKMELDFSAEEALGASKRVNGATGQSADDLNYTLTLKRLLATIKATAENDGARHIAYVVPWFVIDGTTTNQIKLAKQLKKRLQELGYNVRRDYETLYIDWDLDLMREEKRLEQERKRKYKELQAQEQKRLKELKEKAKYGKKSVKLTDEYTNFGLSDRPPLAKRLQNNNNTYSITRKKKSKR